MREPITTDSLQAFMKGLAAAARSASRVYLVGGASAVLLGWRNSTIDIDLKIIPESDEILRSLPRLKEQLHVNIELASPETSSPSCPVGRNVAALFSSKGNSSSIITTFTPKHWLKSNGAMRLIRRTSII